MPTKLFKKGQSPWNKGKKGVYSKQHLKLLSDIKLKNPTKYWLGKKRPGVTGKLHGKWKGDEVGYQALHAWVRRQLGTPDTCEHCGKIGLEYPFIHWANKSGEYKRNIRDWLRLCVKCHSKHDKK